MTCSRRFGRLLQASCLGLIGTLTVVGCGGSDTKNDAAVKLDTSSAIDGPTTAVGKVTVNPPLIDFGTIDVGSASTAQSVTVTVANAAVALNPSVTGAGFSLAGSTCAASQAPGNCTVSVKFAPGAVGGANGVLTIGAGLSVSLSGTGTAAGDFTASERIDLGSLKVGATAAVSVQITPQGTVSGLTCSSSNATELAPNPTGTTCASTGSVSAPCVYAFTFNAATAGVKNYTVTCVSTKKSTQTPVAATVSGLAVLNAVATTSQLSTAVGKTDTAVITVSNNGQSATVAAPAVTITAGAPDFSITANDCVVALAPLATCHVTVTFAPTAVVASKAGSVSVTDSVTTLKVDFTGTSFPDRSVAITPNPSDFEAVTVNASKATTFTMKNTGGVATGLITLSGATTEFKIGSDQCSGTSLAATTGACTFVVTFAPVAPAGARATIINASDAAGVLASLKLSGTATDAPKGPVLTVTPPTLDFGTIGVGTTAGPKTFTVTNTGDASSAALSVVKNDSTSSVGGASQFTYTTTCTAALAKDEACLVVVTFAPTIRGSASATITVTDGVVSSAARTVVGIALDKPGLTVDCTSGPGVTHDFGSTGTVVGKTSALVPCLVKNDSTSTQETGVLTAVATGDFTVATTGNTCAASLAPGLSCTISIAFAPTAKGQRDGAITVTGANGGAANVNLKGLGLGVVEIVEMSGTTCPAGQTASPPTCVVTAVQPYDFQQLTVGKTNDAAKNLTLQVYVRDAVGNLSVSALPSTGAFAYSSSASSDCRSLATAAFTPSVTTPVCSLVVQFSPKDRTIQSGTVTVTGANGKADSATMTGTGTGPLTISPSPVTFTDVPVGTSSDPITITIANGGTGPIKPMSYTITGANKDQFSIVYDALSGGTIAAGADLKMAVRFIPTSSATATATITVTGTLYDVAGTTAIGTETQTVTLSGGSAAGPSLTASISNDGVFADTYAAAISTPLTITVANAAGSLPSSTVATPSILTGSSDFTVTPPAGQTQGTCVLPTANPIAGGASCTYLVWFTPSAASSLAARTGTIQVANKTLQVSGNALPMLSLSPAGTLAAPTDVTAAAVAIVNTTPAPSVTFTVTNHAATDIPAGKLVISKATSANGPNLASLFVVDTSASNTCNDVVAKNGGTCIFKVSATAVDDTKLGAFFTQLAVTYADATAQKVVSEMKATVATAASLEFTPSTSGARDFGRIELGTSSAPVKFTVVNVGGSNSSAITAAITDTTATTKAGRFSVDASNCTALGETGLAPGKTCDILVTASVTPNAPSDASVTITGTLAVTATNGTAGLTGGKLSASVSATASAFVTSVYLVDDATGQSPSNLGIVSGVGSVATPLTVTKTIAFHNPTGSTVTLPDTAISSWLAVTSPASLGTAETVTIAAGTTSPCARNGSVAADAKCTLTVTWAFTDAAPVAGQRVFTVTVGSASMVLLGSVSTEAALATSRTDLDFGQVVLNANSQSETVVIKNTGETTSANVGVKLSPNTGVIHTSGCTGAPLAYGASCTLTIYITPQATGAGTGTVTLQLGGVDTTTVLNLGWTGVVSAAIGSTNAPKDFGNQAVLSTTSNSETFTFSNGANSQKTGALSVSVVNSSGEVVPDFRITGGTCLSVGNLAALGGSCTVTVAFTPLALSPAVKNASLVVSATPGGAASVELTGTAVAPLSVIAAGTTGGTLNTALTVLTITASPSVASGASTDVTVQFGNEDNAPTTGLLSAVLSSTADLPSFLVKDDQCTGKVLAGGAKCTVQVSFAPKSTGAKTATITLSGTPGNSVAVVLNGTPAS